MKAGRPPKYKTVEELQQKIDEYFKSCEGEMLKDENGEAVLDKHGNPVWIHIKPPTVTGLALALGFTSRQSLLDYQAKPQFLDTIARAKSRCEQYAEERLFDRDGANGAKFSLTNNFKGWHSEKAVDDAADTTPADDGFLSALDSKAAEVWPEDGGADDGN